MANTIFISRQTNLVRGSKQLCIKFTESYYILSYDDDLIFESDCQGIRSLTNSPFEDFYKYSEPLGVHLWLNNYFLLHANATRLKGRAQIFTGIAGRGKSTLAAALAQAGYKVLSDDMAAVQFDDSGIPMTRPGPQWIKVWPSAAEMLELPQEELEPLYEGTTKLKWTREDLFQKEPVPLGDIFILQERSEEPFLCPFSPAESFMELIKYFPLPSQLLEGEAHAKYFQLTRRILDHTRVFALSLPNHPKKIVPFLESVGILGASHDKE